MPDWIKEADKQLFFLINGWHSPTFDPLMYYLTNTWFWAPLYVWMVYLIFRKEHGGIWLWLAGIAVTVVLADQVTSSLMKPFFERLRPSRDPALEGLVHTVNGYRGGLYGFASSHAANTFGTATFIFVLLRRQYRFTGFIFLWAFFVSYSRIYLGVHYPGDILAGASTGILIALFVHRLCQKLERATRTTRE